MQSCLYQGKVHHARFSPKDHRFNYNIVMSYIDLAELEDIFKDVWFCSYNKKNILSIQNRDHIDKQDLSLKTKILSLLDNHDIKDKVKNIGMLTHFRSLGYYFSPLSVFYLYDAEQQLIGLVMEVSNTPWGEKHCYVLEQNMMGSAHNDRFACHATKQLHVSPFMPMDLQHEFTVNHPSEELFLQISDKHDTTTIFTASMNLQRIDLNKQNLTRLLMKNSTLNIKIISAIYWQAFRLFAKGIPFHSHPKCTFKKTQD